LDAKQAVVICPVVKPAQGKPVDFIARRVAIGDWHDTCDPSANELVARVKDLHKNGQRVSLVMCAPHRAETTHSMNPAGMTTNPLRTLTHHLCSCKVVGILLATVATFDDDPRARQRG
jgi:hypothetical protein